MVEYMVECTSEIKNVISPLSIQLRISTDTHNKANEKLRFVGKTECFSVRHSEGGLKSS